MLIDVSNKFGNLRPYVISEVSRGSHKKILWKCDCGKLTETPACQVLSGKTKTCGKCNTLSANHWLTTKYGSLKLKNPIDISSGSRQLHMWTCDCGRDVLIKVYDVFRGHTTSCGRCNELPATHWLITKYGKLRLAVPQDVLPGSSKKICWICDCGRSTMVSPHCVTSGVSRSCGKCSILPALYWETTKFGRLRMSNPVNMKPGSNRKVSWGCDCGSNTKSDVYAVTSGATKSCGSCMVSVHEWFRVNKQVIRSLRYPISPDQIPLGSFRLLDSVIKPDIPVQALCGVCGSEYFPIWGNIRQGRSMTCGCASNHTSSASCEVLDFISSLGAEAEAEYMVGGLSYDVGIPSKKLLIEYNGLRWHSRDGSRVRDFKKYQNAINNGWDFISIFEDEWLFSRSKFEGILKNRIGTSKLISVRPSLCEFSLVSAPVANQFYEKHHYIGPGSGPVHYGVFFNGSIIGCMSFGRPGRQTSNYQWELVRMASDSIHRVHGAWSKLFKIFVLEHSPESIVSFSENRLFSGQVYKSIGFILDGEIAQNYYWVKGSRRFHKSGLRKPKGMDGTESQLRESEGYRKIWDLGKKRWVYRINPTQ